MSLQVGKLKAEIIEQKSIDRIDVIYYPPYDKGNPDGFSNLLALVNIAESFPDKIFVAAGGNLGDNFCDLKTDLQKQGNWPNNLILVTSRPRRIIDRPEVGSDFVIDTISFGIAPDKSSSSAATAIATAIIQRLLK